SASPAASKPCSASHDACRRAVSAPRSAPSRVRLNMVDRIPPSASTRAIPGPIMPVPITAASAHCLRSAMPHSRRPARPRSAAAKLFLPYTRLADNNKCLVKPMHIRVLGIVLAGGKGTRLYPLTKERAKPAVPFGGRYRIIDFVLSNLVNSGIYSIYVLVQFKSQSLLQHLREGWEASSLLRNHFIIPVPAQMRSLGEDWYRGTADAIYQNINLIEQAEPHVVAIFGADHIYRMNIREMVEFHVDRGAQVTVSAIPVEKEQAIE